VSLLLLKDILIERVFVGDPDHPSVPPFALGFLRQTPGQRAFMQLCRTALNVDVQAIERALGSMRESLHADVQKVHSLRYDSHIYK
jgi:hypothetical protein